MMRRATLTAALVATLCLPAGASLAAQDLGRGAPEEVGISSERLRRVDRVFRKYVDDGVLPGAVGMVIRHDKVVYTDAWGMRDVEARDAMEADDIFRIYSMTKPITSVAVMMLYEEGRFFLDDPVGRYLPELGSVPVADLDAASGPDDIPTVRANRPMTVRDLLRHTSGLTYGTFSNTVVDRAYRAANIPGGQATLAEMVTELGKVPLLYQPGTRWNYSLSADVLGRLVEVLSGQPFDVFLRERIFEPLGMKDTGFYVQPSARDRFAQIYGHAGRGQNLSLEVGDQSGFTPDVTRFSGGGGLVSTAQDYARFAQMLLNGGELDGVRILSPTTIDLMTMDHLHDDGASFLADGWGFGLGFTVKDQAGLDGLPDAVGTYYWFGVAGTSFWIDPENDLIGVFMIQMRPSRINFRDQFKRLVYQAVVD